MALVHALLSALIWGSSTGYDLAQRFDGSVGFFWRATHQQIYHELRLMEERGLIEVEVVPQDKKPDKKVYEVTPQGRRALEDWILTPCEPSTYKEDILVKLFAGPIGPVAPILEELERHRVVHEERIAEYNQIRERVFARTETLPATKRWGYLTLRCGLRLEQAWLEWCEEAIETMRREAG